MKSPKSHLNAFRQEPRDERTDRVARELVEEAAAERRERSQLLRKTRLERDGPNAGLKPRKQGPAKDATDEAVPKE